MDCQSHCRSPYPVEQVLSYPNLLRNRRRNSFGDGYRHRRSDAGIGSSEFLFNQIHIEIQQLQQLPSLDSVVVRSSEKFDVQDHSLLLQEPRGMIQAF